MYYRIITPPTPRPDFHNNGALSPYFSIISLFRCSPELMAGMYDLNCWREEMSADMKTVKDFSLKSHHVPRLNPWLSFYFDGFSDCKFVPRTISS